jgi:hypothetical protein
MVRWHGHEERVLVTVGLRGQCRSGERGRGVASFRLQQYKVGIHSNLIALFDHEESVLSIADDERWPHIRLTLKAAHCLLE